MAVVTILLVVAVLLFALNCWFISRLVKKIDKIDPVSKKVDLMAADVKHVQDKVNQLGEVFHRISELEKQCAVLQHIVDKELPRRRR